MNGKNTEKPATTTVAELLAGARRLLLMHEFLGVPPYPLTPELRKFLQPAPAVKASQTSAASPAVASPVRTPPARTASSPVSSTYVSPAARTESPKPPPREPAASLGHVRETALACDACRFGKEGRARVFGEGRERAPLFIVAEAPGEDEIQQSEAFSGEDRTLLIKMIAAIGFSLDDVYLTNIMKCLPAEGMDEEQSMARHCLAILRDQIRAVGPKMILTMGPLPAAVLTHSATPLLRLRGKIHDFHGLPLIATYHPAFLLRHQEMKKAAWQDLQLLQRHMNKPKR